MLRTALACLLGTVVASFAKSAWGANFWFEGVPTAATVGCPEPCYQVRMFVEQDPFRVLEIQAIQVDVEILDGGQAAVLAVPPAGNSNAAGGNASLEDANGDAFAVPWDLSSTVGRSPKDALVVDAASAPFSPSSVLAVHEAAAGCLSPSVCAIQLDALRLGRIYLGRFNVIRTAPTDPPAHYSPRPVEPGNYFTVLLSGITGNGPALEDLVDFNGLPMSFPYLPEPSTTLLVAGGLTLLAAARRRG